MPKLTKKGLLATVLMVVTGLLGLFAAVQISPAEAAQTIVNTVAGINSVQVPQQQSIPVAAGALYRPFPEGIDPNNPNHALAQIKGRAEWDNRYGTAIAQQTGTQQFVASDYVAKGYRNGMPNTTNSALTSFGTVVPVADHAGSDHVKVLLVINIKTSKTVAIMVRCGNPRLRKTPYMAVLPWKPFAKGTVINVHIVKLKPVSITCPSGQTVSGNVKGEVKGRFSALAWGKVQGSLNLHLKASVNEQIKLLAQLQCGPAPKAPPATTVTTPAPPTVTVTTLVCNGNQVTVRDSNGVVINCIDITVVNTNSNTVTVINNPPPPATTTTATTTTAPKPVHSCSLSLVVQKSINYRTINASTTSDGPISSVSIDWGDNSTGSGTSTSHTYTSDGVKTVKSTVSFSDGANAATCSNTIDIEPDPLPPPPPSGG